MCVIYACATQIPPEEELHRGAFRNDDGAGIAWLGKVKGKEQVFWKKGLKDEKEVLAFIEKEKLELPLAIHFRTASVGGKSTELCHPFPLKDGIPLDAEGSAPEVLMHNGHLNSWEELVLKAALGADCTVPEGEWSDSRALAWLTHLKGPGILPFIMSTSRILLFHAEPDIYEDFDYDRSNDHFSLFGSWVHPKDAGWAQSITTEWGGVVRGKSYSSAEAWFGRDGDSEDDVESLVDACKRDEKEKKTSSSSCSTLTNIWTVAELREVLEKVEKEIGDARTAAGV